MAVASFYQQCYIDNVQAAGADLVEHGIGQGAVYVDLRDRCQGAVEDDVLRLLHVDVGCFEDVEHVSEDARAVAVAHDELVVAAWRRRGSRHSERCPSP